MPTKPGNIVNGKKCKYYLEWWQLGTDEFEIQSGWFHTKYPTHFVNMFTRFEKYTIIYLQRCSDSVILINRRTVPQQR